MADDRARDLSSQRCRPLYLELPIRARYQRASCCSDSPKPFGVHTSDPVAFTKSLLCRQEDALLTEISQILQTSKLPRSMQGIYSEVVASRTGEHSFYFQKDMLKPVLASEHEAYAEVFESK